LSALGGQGYIHKMLGGRGELRNQGKAIRCLNGVKF
jgi:hypothetical protein